MTADKRAAIQKGFILLAAAILCLAFGGSGTAEEETVIDGCALPVTSPDYSTEFVLEDFDVSGIILDDNGDLQLDTQSRQLDPSNIEIPIKQEVSVTFLYENAGYTKTKFGWMYESDVVKGTTSPDTSKIRWLYDPINDNKSPYGVLDQFTTDQNGDGKIDYLDNKKYLSDAKGVPITFQPGDRIVFVLDSSANGDPGGVFYTKRGWNENYTRCSSGISRAIQLYRAWGGTYAPSACSANPAGWMDQDAITRLKDNYGFEFRMPVTGVDPAGFNEVALNMKYDSKAIHAVLGAPNNTPNAWILGFDDQKLVSGSAADMDYNDLVFLIERKTGGVASLKQSKVVSPADDDGFYTKIEFEVEDAMPCPGNTTIDYFYSVNYEKDAAGNDVLDNAGAKKPIWHKIGTEENRWVTVYSFTGEDGPNLTLDQTQNLADTWKPGYPVYTYRKAVIDLVARNNVGRNLLWKAELRSESEQCVPVVMDVKLQGTVARHAFFSRSTPIIQTNLIYSGSYETPDPLDIAWMSDPELRGHLKAVQIYDPDTLTTTSGTDEGNVKWDAGNVLKDRNLTSDPRTIYFPNMTTTVHIATITLGVDGTTKDFTGTLDSYPVLDGTFVVTAQTEDEEKILRTETLKDVYTHDVLDTETPGASGKINRFTGAYEIHFSHPPKAETEIAISYSSYSTTTGTLEILGTGNAKATEALFNIGGTGIDKAKLVKWILGFKEDGTERTWPLGPIDHSAAAIMTPPGIPAWYYSDTVPEGMRNSFYDPDKTNTKTFAATYKDRKVTVFVGSLDGMLHAFDGGTFSWEDNSKTDHKEERGHFVWSGDTSTTAQYGTGEELWAYIPGNLISKMKNNYSKQDFSKALVDASPAICDVYIDNSWRTVLIFAQGSGGHMITCLDVTEPMLPKLLWEFGDPGLFRSQSSPAIGMVEDSGGVKWVSFWVSGHTEPDAHPSVYMVDVATGGLVGGATISLDAAGSEGLGGVGSGQPAIVDSDGDGFIDRFYVGTDKGFMYRVDISSLTSPVDEVINSSERDANRGIYGSPAVVVGEEGVRILFGTGGDAATDDTFSYEFYAYLDTEDGVTLDWSYTLGAQERVYTSAFVAAGQVYFGTTTATSEDPCAAGGVSTGNLYVFKTNPESSDETTPEPLSKIPLPTGSGRISPIVDDEHVYIKTTNGLLRSFGANGYNNDAAGIASEEWGSKVFMRSWREIYCPEEDCLKN